MGRPMRPLRLLICSTAISPAILCTSAVGASGPVRASVPPMRTGGPEAAACTEAAAPRTARVTTIASPRRFLIFTVISSSGGGVHDLRAGCGPLLRPHHHPSTILDLPDLVVLGAVVVLALEAQGAEDGVHLAGSTSPRCPCASWPPPPARAARARGTRPGRPAPRSHAATPRPSARSGSA